MNRRRALLAAIPAWSMASLTPLAQAQDVWTLDRLMQALARAKVSRATFVERKFIAMLDAPVVSSGELLFTAPDRLERRTLKPRAESAVLEGGTLTLVRGERRLVVNVQEQPAIGALVESVRATLAGDRLALERHYTVGLSGDEARWTLVLAPREAKVRALVLEITIGGERGEVRSVEIEQSDKDRSVMTIARAAAS